MGRKPDIERREEILDRAWVYLRQQGTEALTMSSLAQALGMKRTTLYWYFKDLHALFLALLLRLLTRQHEHLEAHLANVDHPVDLLYQHALGVAAFFQGQEDIILLLATFWSRLGGGHPYQIIEASRSFFSPRREHFIQQLRRGIDQGLVHPCDPETVVRFVSAVVDGALVQSITHSGPSQPLHTFLWDHVLSPLKRSQP